VVRIGTWNLESLFRPGGAARPKQALQVPCADPHHPDEPLPLSCSVLPSRAPAVRRHGRWTSSAEPAVPGGADGRHPVAVCWRTGTLRAWTRSGEGAPAFSRTERRHAVRRVAELGSIRWLV